MDKGILKKTSEIPDRLDPPSRQKHVKKSGFAALVVGCLQVACIACGGSQVACILCGSLMMARIASGQRREDKKKLPDSIGVPCIAFALLCFVGNLGFVDFAVYELGFLDFGIWG